MIIMFFLVNSSDQIIDPISYREAIDGSQSKEWISAMNVEMESMASNDV